MDEFRGALHHIHIAADRFNDHAGNLVTELLEGFLKLRGVVVFKNDRVVRDAGRNAGRARVTEREHSGARLHEKTVGVTVVAALELDNLVAARVAAGETDRAHAGFGAGGDETDGLN